MTPENPIVGGTILRIPAISSPNFVQNTSGWSIQQNGDAFFADVTITGGNVVVAGANGGVFVYSGTPANGNLVASVAGMAGTDPYGNAYPEGFASYGSGATAGVTALFNVGILEWTYSGFTQNAQISINPIGAAPQMTIIGPSDNADYAQIQLGKGAISGSEVALAADNVVLTTYTDGSIQFNCNPSAAGGSQITTDTPIQLDTSWTNLTLKNGWVARGGSFAVPQYRMMPDGTVLLRGQMVSGTTTDSTVIATLPVGYQTSVDDNYPIAAFPGSTSENAVLEVAVNGDLLIFGVGSSPILGIGGVRFPVSPL